MLIFLGVMQNMQFLCKQLYEYCYYENVAETMTFGLFFETSLAGFLAYFPGLDGYRVQWTSVKVLLQQQDLVPKINILLKDWVKSMQQMVAENVSCHRMKFN